MSTGMTTQGWVADFCNWLLAGGVSRGTMKNRAYWVSRFLKVQPDPGAATTSDLAAFLAEPSWSAETRRSAKASLSVFYEWALMSGLVDSDPTVGLRRISVPPPLPRPAPDEVLAEALERCTEPWERLAVLLAAFAGLRRAEIAGLRASDVVDGEWILVRGKGGRQRRVPIHDELRPDLMYAVRWAKDDWVFPSRYAGRGHMHVDVIGKRLSELLGPGYTGHTLRHRFATEVYRGSKDIRATQALLGHASTVTTQRYTALVDDDLAEAVGMVPSLPVSGARAGEVRRLRTS